MNAIRRIVHLFLLLECVFFAGSAMAFDLGGMLKQVEEAAQQQNPNNTNKQPAAQPAQPAKPEGTGQVKEIDDVIVPDYVETSEPLELKGIKIGMTVQELQKLYPQANVITFKPQDGTWIIADQLIGLSTGRFMYLLLYPIDADTRCGGTCANIPTRAGISRVWILSRLFQLMVYAPPAPRRFIAPITMDSPVVSIATTHHQQYGCHTGGSDARLEQ